MGRNDDEKLKLFEAEAKENARKVCAEIESAIQSELGEKIDAADRVLAADMYNYIQNEIISIRKSKALEISRENMKARSTFLEFCDAAKAEILGILSGKLKDFMHSPKYAEYILKSAENVVRSAGADIDIIYMESDAELIENLSGKIRAFSPDGEKIGFFPDSEIKLGGIAFYDRNSKILINDVFDEKLVRSEEILNTLTVPLSKIT